MNPDFRTKPSDSANVAFRVPGETNVSPVEDEQMAGQGPTILGDDLHQFEFDFIRIIGLSPAQAVRNSFYVRVYGNGLLSIHIAQDDVGCFPTHSWESGELL